MEIFNEKANGFTDNNILLEIDFLKEKLSEKEKTIQHKNSRIKILEDYIQVLKQNNLSRRVKTEIASARYHHGGRAPTQTLYRHDCTDAGGRATQEQLPK